MAALFRLLQLLVKERGDPEAGMLAVLLHRADVAVSRCLRWHAALQELALNHNSLSTLPAEISALAAPQLQWLALQHNSLSTLSGST